MSWHYSQALEAAYSVANSSAGAPSAPSKSTSMPAPSSWLGKMTDASQPSLFGPTSEVLTVGRGMAWWISSLADSRARTSALPDQAQESTVSEADCGLKCPELLARFDLASCSWKILPCSPVEGSSESSVTWPRWGMMRAGECWERSTPMLPIDEQESGLWPTPTATDGKGSPGPESVLQRAQENSRGVRLAEEIVRRQLIPTPTAGDAKSSGSRNTETSNAHAGVSITDFVRMDGGKGREEDGGVLNPTWVEWLMGWPLGWTDCAASATDKFPQWSASHGITSHRPPPKARAHP